MVQQGQMIFRCARGLWLAAALVAGSALAEAAASAQADNQAAPVLTRARVVSVKEEAGSKLYVRLELLPRFKLPFATHRLRVADRALLAGIAEGVWVRFSARHVDGENTLASIQLAEECNRFQPCN